MLTVEARDSDNVVVEQSFTVKVNEFNDTPTDVIPDVTVDEDSDPTVYQPDGQIPGMLRWDQLTYTVVGNTNSSLFSLITIDPITYECML